MSLVQEIQRLSPMARRLVAMKFLTSVGMVASYFIGILGTLVYSLGGGALYTSWIVGLINAMEVVGTFAAGTIVDALGPRRHFRIDISCVVLASVAFPLLSGTTPGVLLGAAIFGFSWGMTDPIMRAYPAYLTDDPAELKTINAAMNTVIATGVVVGPLVGSAIAAVAGTQAVLAFPALCSLVALVPGAGFAPLRDPRAVGAAGAVGDGAAQGPDAAGAAGDAGAASAPASAKRASSVAAGFRAIAASSTLALLDVAGFLAFFAYGAFDPLEILYYKDVLRVGTDWIGILSSAGGVGAILGGFLLMRVPEWHVNLRTFLLCLSLEGVGCIIYVGTDNVWIALLGQIILGAANGAFNPMQATLVQLHAPLEAVGRVSAVIGFSYSVAGVLPLLAAPALAAAIGVQGTLVASGACVAVIPLLFMALLRRRIAASVAEERERGAHVTESEA